MKLRAKRRRRRTDDKKEGKLPYNGVPSQVLSSGPGLPPEDEGRWVSVGRTKTTQKTLNVLTKNILK